ncbi:hypothetical protein ACIPPM_05965 [Streptomyces sp. NPDC090119]|uniref:hypothetical protein n=1 Tax=Streptomyces sp. NPDC090119 TaxID=3365951 RepID=UPI0037FB84F3
MAGDEPERSDAETVMRAYVQKLVAKDAKGIEKLARPGNLDTRCVADHWVSKYGEAAELGRVFVRVYAADTPSRTHALLIYDGTQDEQKVRLQKVENVWWINMGRVRGSGVDPCGAPAHD